MSTSMRSHKRKASGVSDVGSLDEPSSSRRKAFNLAPKSPLKVRNGGEVAHHDFSLMDNDLDAEGEDEDDDMYMDPVTEDVLDYGKRSSRNTRETESTPVRKARTIRLTNRPTRSVVGTPFGRVSIPEDNELSDDTPSRSRRTLPLTSTTDDTSIALERDSNARPPTFSEEPEISEEAKRVAKLEKEEEDMRNRWMDEYFDIVEQLPLEVHRTFALIRELEGQTHSRFNSVVNNMVKYRDARIELNERAQANITKSSDGDLSHNQEENGTDASAPAPQQSGAPNTDDSGETMDIDGQDEEANIMNHDTRRAVLRSISDAANESVKGAEEKMGLAIMAYNLIDRHIRRLDGDISKMESSILLGLRSGTEESRGVREALGLPVDDEADLSVDDPKASDQRGSDLTKQAESASLTKAARAKKGADATRGTRASLSATATPKNAKSTRYLADTDASKTSAQKANTKSTNSARGNAAARMAADLSVSGMAYDPTEPTYCYCDQVSVDEMVACENDDCKLEWFHYACVGLETAPKGKWFCRFCAPPTWKGPGMAVPANAKFKPPGWKKGGIKG